RSALVGGRVVSHGVRVGRAGGVVFDPWPGWRNGRRGGLKIRCPKGRGGSSPSPGTAGRSPGSASCSKRSPDDEWELGSGWVARAASRSGTRTGGPVGGSTAAT